MKLHTETMKLNELIINDVSEYKTIEKTALNLHKQADLIALEIDEKEVDLENLLNEIARV
jgi:coiled-coil domain-containing protein 40